MPNAAGSIFTTLVACCLALGRPAAALAEEAPPPITHVIHPFGMVRAEWSNNVTGADSGDSIVRVIAGATYRYDHPGGTSFTLQYQGQYVKLFQLSALDSMVHVGTAMISHFVPIRRANLLADAFTPYIGAQVIYTVPTNSPGARTTTDGDYFLGFSFIKSWSAEHLLYYGLHAEYFGAQLQPSAYWAGSGILGYRWTPSAMVQMTADNRVQWRNPTMAGLSSSIREQMSVEVDVFPYPWLQVGPTANFLYDTGGRYWSWTAGLILSSNLWYLK